MQLSQIALRGRGKRERRGFTALSSRIIHDSPALIGLTIITAVVVLFTTLLRLPIAAADGRATVFHDAFFTAMSAVTVTGLVAVDTAEHWSFFGQSVILAAIQVGGLGIVTLALLLSRAVTRHLGVRGRVIAQQNIGTSKLGEVQSLLRTVILTTVVLELGIAAALIPRFLILEPSVPQALWHGLFYSISAFNNAGFVVHSGGLTQFDGDLWILVPIMVGVFIGSFGFPVFLAVIVAKWKFRSWSLHTKMTLTVTTILLFVGAAIWALFEWGNGATIGDEAVGEKVLHALFASTMMRSGGFELVSPSDSYPVTLLATDALMFVGGGSASTAGGIKVTTIAVLFLAIVAEAKGDRQIAVFSRTVPEGALRVAISVTFLGATLVLGGTGLIMMTTSTSLDRILFEVISAFATCGLSVGLSPELPPAGKYVLAGLMFAGRIGPIGLASVLAVRRRNLLYRYPDESPVIG